jgi:histidinol-phosphate phosphatase family protein
MKAVILAGGKGTRLKEYTQNIPKPMLKIGNKPVLEHQIEILKRHQIVDIIFLVNHLKSVIIDYFGNGKNFGVNIDYYEENEPLGTAGGLREIQKKLNEDFLFIYGDTIFDIDLERLIKFHTEKNSDFTLVAHPNDHPFDSDLIDIDKNEQVVKILPKSHKRDFFYKNLVNAGMYVVSPSVLKYIPKAKKSDFGKDILPRIIDKVRVFAYNTSEYIKDMGTPERLSAVRNDYNNRKIFRRSYLHKQKAIFLDRDGVINKYKGLIYKPEQLEIYPFSIEALKILNNSDYLAIIVTNQPVVARNLCTIEELEYIHKKMETIFGNQGAKFDAIYYCPHHPDKGYKDENPEYKIDCPCRKPKPGMLLKAAEKFNIDLSESYIIGDSFFDILAGYNAGVTPIAVKTGVGLNQDDRKRFLSKGYQLKEPAMIFDNLLEAVKKII